MTVVLGVDGHEVFLSDPERQLTGKYRSQLAFWGFRWESALERFAATPTDSSTTVAKVSAFLTSSGLLFTLTNAAATSQADREEHHKRLRDVLARGERFKSGNAATDEYAEFRSFVASHLKRPLKQHQYNAALHLLAVENGANFSVPGAGKTSVVLAVFGWLKKQGIVDSLFVIGPPACFRPWRDEYRAVLGESPTYKVLAGGVAATRREAYLAGRADISDLYLISFQTLQRDADQAAILLRESGARFFLVVDEAHNIKQVGGTWAASVMQITSLATRRCVLTGTPFPRAYSDAFNLFDTLWPSSPVLTPSDRTELGVLADSHRDDQAAQLLRTRIGPLFYRVRKSDLNLAPQVFHDPVVIEMNPVERHIYDSLIERVRNLAIQDYFRDIDLLMLLRRARMMRLRQTVAYAKLLASPTSDAAYDDAIGGDGSLAELIIRYDEKETPAKIGALVTLVDTLRGQGEKILIWSTFIGSLELLVTRLSVAGHAAKLIYGATPPESTSEVEQETREQIIAAFSDASSGVDILVANPAACAESISLHRACSHAIYYDLSYNCGQYLQSLDRIHRVGGSETKPAHYHFLQYANSIDQDILANLQKKARRMSAVIDHEYAVYSLDMFSDDDELEAYGRIFGNI
jgi:superfamily II DNA or RNA helicase